MKGCGKNKRFGEDAKASDGFEEGELEEAVGIRKMDRTKRIGG